MSWQKEKRWRKFCGNESFRQKKQDLTQTTLTMRCSGGIASRLRSPRPMAAVAELGSLDLLSDSETSRFWVSRYCPGSAFLFFLCGPSPTRCHQRPGARRCRGIESHAEHHPPGEMRTSLASADATDIYHYSFDRQYVP